MAGFSHDLAGGNGNLIATSIQSPNFSTATKSGWQINKNGDATFYELTIQGGDIIGATILTYKGTPGLGTLYTSLSSTITTDQFGNTVKDGYTVYANGDDGPSAQMAVNQMNNVPYLILAPGGSHNTTPGQIFTFVSNEGLVNEFVQLQMFGPQQTADDAGVILTLYSAANDGSTEAAGYLQSATGSSVTNQAYWDATGIHIESQLYGTNGILTCGDNVFQQGLSGYKTVNTSYTSTTVSADPALSVTLEASAVYEVRARISFWSSTAGTDLKYQFNSNGSSDQMSYTVMGNGVDGFDYSENALGNTNTINNTAASTNYGMLIEGLVRTSITGGSRTLQMYFGRVNNTSINVNTGSYLVVRRVG